MIAEEGPPQVIPRPAFSRPGPPPPWSGFTGHLGLDVVRPAVETPLEPPGIETGDARPSAVLALLFEEGGETRIVLTRRAATLRSHRSEVSFPGGRSEPSETTTQTALRETWEEVRVPPGAVTLIGRLSPLLTVSSSALIWPYIGVVAARPSLTIDPSEVERAFDIALVELLGAYRSEVWRIGEEDRVMHFFDLPHDIIWGATGRMLWELLAKATNGGSVTDDGDPLVRR